MSTLHSLPISLWLNCLFVIALDVLLKIQHGSTLRMRMTHAATGYSQWRRDWVRQRPQTSENPVANPMPIDSLLCRWEGKPHPFGATSNSDNRPWCSQVWGRGIVRLFQVLFQVRDEPERTHREALNVLSWRTRISTYIHLVLLLIAPGPMPRTS